PGDRRPHGRPRRPQPRHARGRGRSGAARERRRLRDRARRRVRAAAPADRPRHGRVVLLEPDPGGPRGGLPPDRGRAGPDLAGLVHDPGPARRRDRGRRRRPARRGARRGPGRAAPGPRGLAAPPAPAPPRVRRARARAARGRRAPVLRRARAAAAAPRGPDQDARARAHRPPRARAPRAAEAADARGPARGARPAPPRRAPVEARRAAGRDGGAPGLGRDRRRRRGRPRPLARGRGRRQRRDRAARAHALRARRGPPVRGGPGRGQPPDPGVRGAAAGRADDDRRGAQGRARAARGDPDGGRRGRAPDERRVPAGARGGAPRPPARGRARGDVRAARLRRPALRRDRGRRPGSGGRVRGGRLHDRGRDGPAAPAAPAQGPGRHRARPDDRDRPVGHALPLRGARLADHAELHAPLPAQRPRPRPDRLLGRVDRRRVPRPQPAREREGVGVVLLLLLGAALVALAVFAALDALFSPAEARRASRRLVTYATVSQAPRVAALERPRLREAVVPALSRVAQRLTPKGQRAKLQLRLEAAGLASRLDSEHFLALKTVLAVLSVAVALAAAGVSVGGLALGLVLVAASLFGPERALVRLARSRADRLTAHLPEVIDQIVISLEAGLAFDAAVSYFVRKGRSPLVAELRVLLSEVRMGDSRVEALKRLADRVPSDEMRNFVQTLVQSEGVGISRAAILRNQAADLRERR